MKLLLLAITAILLASAFALQARAESAISLIAANRQPAVVTGFVTPPPHGTDPSRSNSSDFLPPLKETGRGVSHHFPWRDAPSDPNIYRVWSR